jgi:hypothetical protein
MEIAVLVMAAYEAGEPPKRSKIFGTAGIRLTVTDMKAADSFYTKILEADRPCVWCGEPSREFYPVFYAYNDQHVLLDPAYPTDPRRRDMSNLLEEITFFTDSVPAMRRYWECCGAATSPEPENHTEDVEVRTADPEDHVIGFVQRPRT